MRLADDDTLESSSKHDAPNLFESLFHTVPQAAPSAARITKRGGWRKLNTAIHVGSQFSRATAMGTALATEAKEASNMRGRRWAAAGRRLTQSLARMEAQRLAPVAEGAPAQHPLSAPACPY